MRIAIVVLLCIVARASTISDGAERSFTTTTARISTPEAGKGIFWTIATSHTDPRYVVLCGQRNGPDVGKVSQDFIYGSRDGGETWKLLKTSTYDAFESEPDCAMGAGGNVYFASSAEPILPAIFQSYTGNRAIIPLASPTEKIERMHLVWSHDFGATWHTAPGSTYSDSETIIVQKIEFSGAERLVVFSDEDGRKLRIFPALPGSNKLLGPSILPPVAGMSVVHGDYTGPKRAKVRADFTVVSDATEIDAKTIGGVFLDRFFPQVQGQADSAITFTRITREGHAIGVPITIANLSNARTFEKNFGTQLSSRYASITNGDVPQSAGKRRLYVVWHDVFDGRMRILLAISDDQGISWSAPRPVDDAAPGANPAFPSITANAQGVVGLTWTEFGGRCWHFAASRDGRHFDASIPTSPCASRNDGFTDRLAGYVFATSIGWPVHGNDKRPSVNMEINTGGRPSTPYDMLIHTRSLTATQDGSFLAVWSMLGTRDAGFHVTRITPSDNPEMLRRRSIMDQARCCLPKSALVWLDYTHFSYDPLTREFAIGVVMMHRRDAGNWPLVLRVKTLRSKIGDIQAINADNGLSGNGAAWVFDGPASKLPQGSAASFNGRFFPHAQYDFSSERTIHFRLVGVSKAATIGADGNLVKLDNEVLSSR